MVEPIYMTARKPPGTSFTSWIDQQINEAAKRGAFDNLPGAGKPLPRRAEADDGQAWLRDYLRREGVSAEELLPTPLKLRIQVERLTGTVHEMRSEQEVRDVVADLNRAIMDWRRIPVGPPVFLPLVDEETMVGRWRDGQPAVSMPSTASADHQTADGDSAHPRWWHRLRRGRRALFQPLAWPAESRGQTCTAARQAGPGRRVGMRTGQRIQADIAGGPTLSAPANGA